jgi:creatinine amidohydrolase
MSTLGFATWPQLQPAPRLLAVPLGATEQHGPHLPLDTDTEIATALAEGAAAALGDIAVAPALPYGSSGEHAGFPGTLSIGLEATELVLVELARSATETVQRVLFVCAHGGNAAALERAVAKLREEGRDVRAWSPSWGGDAHAGRTETSLMLALAPGLVHLTQAAPGNVDPVEELLPELVAAGVRGVSENGVLGDPEGASAAEGAELLALGVADLLARIRAWWP